MQDLPSPADLVAAVAALLRDDIAPTATGAQQFQLRVAINALDLVSRQLLAAGTAAVAERARLSDLLGRTGALDELNRAVCDAIDSGTIDIATPGLSAHLWATTLEKLAVDQPTYAAYRREIER